MLKKCYEVGVQDYISGAILVSLHTFVPYRKIVFKTTLISESIFLFIGIFPFVLGSWQMYEVLEAIVSITVMLL